MNTFFVLFFQVCCLRKNYNFFFFSFLIFIRLRTYRYQPQCVTELAREHNGRRRKTARSCTFLLLPIFFIEFPLFFSSTVWIFYFSRSDTNKQLTDRPRTASSLRKHDEPGPVSEHFIFFFPSFGVPMGFWWKTFLKSLNLVLFFLARWLTVFHKSGGAPLKRRAPSNLFFSSSLSLLLVYKTYKKIGARLFFFSTDTCVTVKPHVCQ